MDNAARNIMTNDVFQIFGRILTVTQNGPDTPENYGVRTSEGDFLAGRAVSCLIAPEAGDDVLLAGSWNGPCYILAVLERRAESAARLAPQGDLEVSLTSGKLSFAARDGILMATPGSLETVAGHVRLTTPQAEASIENMSYLGSFLSARVSNIKCFAEHIESFVERLTERLGSVMRMVSGSDHLRAECVDHRATKSMHMQAREMSAVADALVKIDADQIHIG